MGTGIGPQLGLVLASFQSSRKLFSARTLLGFLKRKKIIQRMEIRELRPLAALSAKTTEMDHAPAARARDRVFPDQHSAEIFVPLSLGRIRAKHRNADHGVRSLTPSALFVELRIKHPHSRSRVLSSELFGEPPSRGLSAIQNPDLPLRQPRADRKRDMTCAHKEHGFMKPCGVIADQLPDQAPIGASARILEVETADLLGVFKNPLDPWSQARARRARIDAPSIFELPKDIGLAHDFALKSGRKPEHESIRVRPTINLRSELDRGFTDLGVSDISDKFTAVEPKHSLASIDLERTSKRGLKPRGSLGKGGGIAPFFEKMDRSQRINRHDSRIHRPTLGLSPKCHPGFFGNPLNLLPKWTQKTGKVCHELNMTKGEFSTSQIIVFGDGASSGNPGPGGWGSIIAFPDGQIQELGGGDPHTTNNRMELQAVISALAYLREHAGAVRVYTDSTYVIRGITQWCWAWIKRGWKTAEGKDVVNADLWKKLITLVSARGGKTIQWQFLKGHSGIPGNERVDEIAVAFSKGKRPSLYSGSLLQYGVAIHDLPEESQMPDLPEMRPREAKAPAFSYLSVVNGKLEKHASWKECEARVKGRPGAKFKKAMSLADEGQILREWGLSGKNPKEEDER